MAYGDDASPKDRARVMFVISLMEKDAMAWAQRYVDTLSTTKPHAHLDHYSDFMEAMEKHFGDQDRKRRAEDKIEQLSQGSRPAADYIAEFSNLIAIAGWTEFAPKYRAFRRGVSPKVLDLLIYAPRPKTMEEAYENVMNADSRIREDEVERKHRNALHPSPSPHKPNKPNKGNPPPPPRPSNPTSTSTPSSSSPPPLPKNADPSAMEIDSTGKWKVKDSVKAQRMKDGLCLRCGGSGHVAKNCDKSGSVAVLEDSPEDSGKATA